MLADLLSGKGPNIRLKSVINTLLLKIHLVNTPIIEQIK